MGRAKTIGKNGLGSLSFLGRERKSVSDTSFHKHNFRENERLEGEFGWKFLFGVGNWV